MQGDKDQYFIYHSWNEIMCACTVLANTDCFKDLTYFIWK